MGRSSKASFCILLHKDKLTELSQERLSALCDSNDGFAIAEKDLEIRGPGEILGSQQTGVLPFRYANLVRDNKYLTDTKNIAERIYDADKEKANQLMKRWISGIISYANAWNSLVITKLKAEGLLQDFTIAITLIRMFIDGPDVSLKGSPTVSPTTVAEWVSDPLPPKFPFSTYFLALSQAPPALAIMRPMKHNQAILLPTSRLKLELLIQTLQLQALKRQLFQAASFS